MHHCWELVTCLQAAIRSYYPHLFSSVSDINKKVNVINYVKVVKVNWAYRSC